MYKKYDEARDKVQKFKSTENLITKMQMQFTAV